MVFLSVALRILLAAVLVVAAVAKLLDRKGSRGAVADFGVPARLVGPVAVTLPGAELVLAALLMPGATAVGAAVGAVALLATFTVAIAVKVLRGERIDCHCFGALGSKPVGASQLARNAVLLAVAGTVVAIGLADPPLGALSWVSTLETGEAIAVVNSLLLAGAACGWYALLRRHGRVLVRLDAMEQALAANGVALPDDAASADGLGSRGGLEPGTEAPEFELPDLEGEFATLESLSEPGTPVLLLFSDPGCGPCRSLLPDIGRWQTEHADALTVALVTRGGVEANASKAEEHGLTHVLLQEDREVASMYEAHGTPTGVLVGADGLIAAGPAQGADAIRELVARVAGSDALQLVQVHGSGLGEPLPALELPALDGGSMKLGELGGRETLLLFWNPGCGFCQRMLDDLRAWDAARPPGSPDLVVVASGGREANRSLGLRSTVLLDDDFAVGAALGAGGTPMAIRVDRDGRVASQVIAGADAILGAAGAKPAEALAG